jgi:hypothetical protein
MHTCRSSSFSSSRRPPFLWFRKEEASRAKSGDVLVHKMGTVLQPRRWAANRQRCLLNHNPLVLPAVHLTRHATVPPRGHDLAKQREPPLPRGIVFGAAETLTTNDVAHSCSSPLSTLVAAAQGGGGGGGGGGAESLPHAASLTVSQSRRLLPRYDCAAAATAAAAGASRRTVGGGGSQKGPCECCPLLRVWLSLPTGRVPRGSSNAP